MQVPVVEARRGATGICRLFGNAGNIGVRIGNGQVRRIRVTPGAAVVATLVWIAERTEKPADDPPDLVTIPALR
jgi:hypothetical protein